MNRRAIVSIEYPVPTERTPQTPFHPNVRIHPRRRPVDVYDDEPTLDDREPPTVRMGSRPASSSQGIERRSGIQRLETTQTTEWNMGAEVDAWSLGSGVRSKRPEESSIAESPAKKSPWGARLFWAVFGLVFVMCVAAAYEMAPHGELGDSRREVRSVDPDVNPRLSLLVFSTTVAAEEEVPPPPPPRPKARPRRVDVAPPMPEAARPPAGSTRIFDDALVE